MSHETRVLVFVHDTTDGEMVDMQMRKAHVRCTIQRVTAKDQFLKALRTTPPELVIADGGFPRVDVATIMRTALTTSPGTPWVVLSTSQAEDALIRWMKAGAADVVTRKNFTRLGTVVAELLAHPPAAPVPGPGQTVLATPALGAGGRPAASRTSPSPAVPSSGPAPTGHQPPSVAPSARPGSSAPGSSPGAMTAGPPAGTGPFTHTSPLPPALPKEPLVRESPMFREIVEGAADLIAVLDERGVRRYSNRAHGAVLDSPERLQGTVAYVDIHPDDRQQVADALQAGLREGTGTCVEYRLMDKRGSVRVLESIATPLPSADPEERYAVVISRDITDRVQQEHDREALLKALGSLSGERFFQNLGLVLANTLMVRYVLVSRSLYQPVERVRSLAYWANGVFMPSFEYDIADTTCEAVFATGEPVHYPDSVQELFPKERALVEMGARSYLGVPLHGSDGTIVGHIFLMDDKRLPDPSRALDMLNQVAGRTAMEVERFHREQSAGAAESRLRFILESMADGVLVTDSQEIITYLNEQVVPFIKCSGVDLIGKPLTQFVEPPEENAQGALPGEGEARVRFRCCDGTVRPALLLARPMKDGTGRVIGTVFLVRPAAD